jgi:hypothetical protein
MKTRPFGEGWITRRGITRSRGLCPPRNEILLPGFVETSGLVARERCKSGLNVVLCGLPPVEIRARCGAWSNARKNKKKDACISTRKSWNAVHRRVEFQGGNMSMARLDEKRQVPELCIPLRGPNWISPVDGRARHSCTPEKKRAPRRGGVFDEVAIPGLRFPISCPAFLLWLRARQPDGRPWQSLP